MLAGVLTGSHCGPMHCASDLCVCSSVMRGFAQLQHSSLLSAPKLHTVSTARIAARSTRAMASAGDADPSKAFISQFRLEGAQGGPLSGLTLAVKDLFDIAGHKTGFGSPRWLDTHDVASTTAPPVAALLAAGVTIVGKTHMSELAYSLDGNNAHYGTPINAAAPGRNTGGSSSGSAAAVAAGQADIGLGSDTGGSVRIPASYCGLYGIRPTWGRISLEHACPLAPSFDTVGWFTRDAALLQRVGDVLLPAASRQPHTLERWLVGKDAFGLAGPETAKAIYEALAGDKFAAVQAALGSAPSEVDIAGAAFDGEGLGQLQQWADVFRICQGYDVWQALGSWVAEAKPSLGPGVSDRFKMASGITKEQCAAATAKRQRIKQHLLDVLGTDGLLAVPSAPGPAFVNDGVDAAAFQQLRLASLSLTCIAGLGGLPQVSVPIAKVDGAPVGLSFIGPPGSDEQLLQLAVRLTGALQQQQQ